MTARIQQVTHADAVAIKTVRYAKLRPLAIMREKLRYEPEIAVDKGDFVFFLLDKKVDGKTSSLVVAGKITSVGDDEYEAHVKVPQ